MNNNYGKYPTEPYGALGGYHRNSSNGVAAGLGTIVGWLIGSFAIVIFKLFAGIVKSILRLFKASVSGLRSGITDAAGK